MELEKIVLSTMKLKMLETDDLFLMPYIGLKAVMTFIPNQNTGYGMSKY